MRCHWLIASSLAFVALASSLCAQSTALDEGVEFIREGRFDQALVKLEEAHRVAPNDATVENLGGIGDIEYDALNTPARSSEVPTYDEPGLEHSAAHLGAGQCRSHRPATSAERPGNREGRG